MTSVLSSYRQTATKGSYFITTGSTYLYTVRTIPGSVYLQGATTAAAVGAAQTSAPNSGESLPDASTVPVAATQVGSTLSAGVLLKDLGREIDIYYNNAASGTITSPYALIATWRQVALVANGYLGATGWIKVWSVSGTAIAPVARAAL
jgi:hypothetical protein